MTSQVSVSAPPASEMPTSHGVPLLHKPCNILNEVSPDLLRTVNSIEASLSVPTVARQPLLSRVLASASAFSRDTVRSLTFLISAPSMERTASRPRTTSADIRFGFHTRGYLTESRQNLGRRDWLACRAGFMNGRLG